MAFALAAMVVAGAAPQTSTDMSVLAAMVVAGAAPLTSTDISLTGSHDFLLSGGAEVGNYGGQLDVRSGSPHTTTTAGLAARLTPGINITSLQLTYR